MIEDKMVYHVRKYETGSEKVRKYDIIEYCIA